MRAALTLLAALAGCAAGPEVVIPATPPPRAERPVYAVGDKWIRNDGIYDLIRVEKDRYVFVTDGGREIHLSRDLVPMAWGRKYFEWEFFTFGEYSAPPLSWPLEVGKSGTSRGVWRFFRWQTRPYARRAEENPTFTEPWRIYRRSYPPWVPGPEYAMATVPADFTWTVEAYEEVRVAAGTFKAFRIYYEITPRYGDASRWWLRTWYAPELRQLVKAEGRKAGLLAFEVVAIDQPVAAPFRVVFDEPKDQARLASEALTVTGKVTSSKGVSRVTVTLNGEEVFRQDEAGAPKPELGLSIPIKLREGRNLLLVTVTDAAGESRQEARTVFYDVALARTTVEEQRQFMVEARGDAARADAERLAPALWTLATSMEREAEGALGTQDYARARTAYREAQEAYARATGEARQAAEVAQRVAESRQAREQTAEARRAAEVADAARLAPSPWGRATTIQREAEADLGRQDFDAAQARFREAQQAYRDAEQEATQKAAAAAAAERARLAALRRQLEAAEQVAAAAATARREAEQAGVPRYAPQLFTPAQEKEQQGQAALDRQDYAAAQQRFREAQQAYQQAIQEARRAAEVERREAALQAQRQREAEQARGEMAEARRQAEEADARRWVPQAWAAAAAREAEGQTALGRREYPVAQQRFRDAQQGYRQATAESRKVAEAALPPLLLAFAAPRDQLRVEQETIALAGVVSGGKGVRRVLVTLDGVEVGRLEEPRPARSLAVNLPVKLRDGQNTLVVTATEGDGTLHQEVRTVHYEKPVPLTVTVRYPEDRARLTDDATVVAAVVTSSKGIARVSVSLNGTEIHQQTERTPRKSLAVAVPVTLRTGPNAIVLTATEPDGAVRQEIRTVVYERPKEPAAEPVAPPRPAPDRWAVVIGIGRYEHRDIPRLHYTVPDADAVYETLIGPGGFKRENVLLLTDTTEKKPTLRNVKWALGTFLARSARKEDTVVIFYAGHGAPEIDPRGVERDGLAKYLVPIDAEPDDLFSTALPMDDIHTIFERIEAERVVAFLDTCYSGAAGGRTFASKRTRAGHVDDLFLERLARSKGRAIITAARPAEVSLELPELGHGLFTYYLVQGLRGAADLNRDGIVALQELYEYLEREVTRKSRAAGGNQHPVMKGELEGMLPLVKVQP